MSTTSTIVKTAPASTASNGVTTPELDRLTPTTRPRIDLERGAATAEYAIATLAACGFAAVLVGLLASGEVRELLFGIIRSALGMGS
ncbi:DUF4244 domain-containing protein [Devriesea agamarum]|uniref:DUF4244 domain-containing protein n=1 Tax=Devriesea agamarum TaxID=472569 RepID=UPI00071C873B|nr:DUF4244 domain-containing protein [Devriesea agamarum]